MGSAWAILAYGTLGGLGFLLVPRFMLWLVGFTCGGVRKHSYASEYHSLLGVVESGTPFACLQSTGAGGTPCGVKLGVFLFGCYFTIVLIVMKEFQDLTLVPDHHFNYSTTVVPSKVTDLVTSSLPNSTWSPSF
ncbi:hypothetical protein JTE90_006972 [Oedothorax gibbosus]|uniref:Uncharacterized protein n=1 Tax=Oedothorax gibbosus TaxID=931172 RepID=A0AAV6V8T0_9ARAC|nr:hypothetical protein JTE90_006972 [Oedothorax gibbosus]